MRIVLATIAALLLPLGATAQTPPGAKRDFVIPGARGSARLSSPKSVRVATGIGSPGGSPSHNRARQLSADGPAAPNGASANDPAKELVARQVDAILCVSA